MLSRNLNGLKKKLLVISCTATKRNLTNSAAINVYNGPTFKVIRKANLQNIDILIISANYGLIESDFKISTYNRRMTKKRALELRNEVSAGLERSLASGIYEEAFLELGKDYMNSVMIDAFNYPQIKFTFDSGTIGARLHNLKTWLERN
ncbi:MAG: hypothetical protein QXU18_05135 [Thermoplasmatales archaeon]